MPSTGWFVCEFLHSLGPGPGSGSQSQIQLGLKFEGVSSSLNQYIHRYLD
jgi:hypothetical protein